MREFAQRTGCSNWVANQTLWSLLFLNELHREHLDWSTTWKQELGLFLLDCMLHNLAAMQNKECQRCSQGSESETAESAPEHPSMWTLLGSPDAEILKVAEQVYRGEHAVVPSVLPCIQQDKCMRELHQELARCMARAGLQCETRMARLSLRDQSHSCSCSISWACSPSAGPRGQKQPIDWKTMPLQDNLSWEGIPILGAGNRSRWHWSPSPQYPSRHQSPSPSPLWSHPANKWLSHTMKNLNLQTRLHACRSRAWWDDAPRVAEKLKNQLGLTWKGTWATTPCCPRA